MIRRNCAVGSLLVSITAPLAVAQFAPQAIERREAVERFLQTAPIVGSERLTVEEGTTQPYRLTLAQGDVNRDALWKNPHGRVKGSWEGWEYEIAAYRIDKYLGLGMIPPTVEREFHMKRGSCQQWVDHWKTLEQLRSEGLAPPAERAATWDRALDLQRAFDGLIANAGRNGGEMLVTSDWRLVLIDHSRSFRTGKRYARHLVHDADGAPRVRQLPRAFVERLRALDAPTLREVAGVYQTEKEIAGVIVRAQGILAGIDRLIAEDGTDRVLY